MKKVWRVDVCFEQWAVDEAFVGADSEEEIIMNLDTIFSRKFKKKEIKEIRDSLEGYWPRIKEIPNLYTDKPLVVLDQWGYRE